MAKREALRAGSRHATVLAAALGGLLWVPYGIFEMLHPRGTAKEYRDDKGYDVVVDSGLYALYSLPGSFALLLTALSLLGISGLLAGATGSSARGPRLLAYAAVVLALATLLGVALEFDPLFTGPRIFGTLLLGAAILLVGLRLRRERAAGIESIALVVLGLLGLFLFPLWPLVYAIEIIPTWLGATLIAAIGLGWLLLGYRLSNQPAVSAPS